MKQLLLVVRRLESARQKQGSARRLTISAVAREAGVSAALIHNSYPTIAALIRDGAGPKATPSKTGRAAQLALVARNKKLRTELVALKAKLAKIASVNEMLAMECDSLRGQLDAGRVLPLSNRRAR